MKVIDIFPIVMRYFFHTLAEFRYSVDGGRIHDPRMLS